MTITLVVRPLGQGLYEARFLQQIVIASTRQPLLDSARLLIDRFCPSEELVLRHADSDSIALTSTIRAAAQLTVRENSREGPRFGRWKASPFGSVASPVRFSGNRAPDIRPALRALHGEGAS
jgi:hypothetical protein